MKTSVSIWMPVNVGDYLKRTMHLSTVQHGAYLLLMLHHWSTAEPLPPDAESLANIARMSPRDWARHSPVLARMFTVTDNGWVSAEVMNELLLAETNRQARVKGGKKGAQTRWLEHGSPNGSAMTDPLADPVTDEWQNDGPSPSPSPSPQSGPSSDQEREARARLLKARWAALKAVIERHPGGKPGASAADQAEYLAKKRELERIQEQQAEG